MRNLKKFEIHGPFEPIKKLPKALIKEVKPVHVKVYGKDEGFGVVVAIYEEFQKPNNISLSVCVVIEMSQKVMRIELLETGGRQGFSGNYLTDFKTNFDSINDFILDYTKRLGLSVIDISDPKPSVNE